LFVHFRGDSLMSKGGCSSLHSGVKIKDLVSFRVSKRFCCHFNINKYRLGYWSFKVVLHEPTYNANFFCATLLRHTLLRRQLYFFLLQDPFAFLLTESGDVIFVTQSQNRKHILKKLKKTKTLKKDACGGG